MGQQNSKSTAEERSILHHDGAVAECQRKDACCSQASVFHMQKKMNNLHHSPRTREKSAGYPWPQSRCDAGGLVYVVDSPTGGVWPKSSWDQCRCGCMYFLKKILRGGRRQLALTVLGVRGELLTYPGAIVQQWKEYFQEILNPTNTYPHGGTESGD
ncbi:hypothetical protein D4764_15G0006830 [Takifugu flavidus]|uniref:Uncharacterized protein n=1 Tax=Takifugu flavidus TaxID=433684 RepID=A0A5C6P313_9TELE|nr:hypothetical protein D4764_15G0006830 [Takifugu flavidus]